MITYNLLDTTSSRQVIETKGPFSVLEYKKDISVSPELAQEAYFSSEMNVRKRQLIIELTDSGIFMQAGIMQLLLGQIEVMTDVKSASDLVKKFVSSVVTKETIIKPYYRGSGTIITEPTFRHILLEDISKWDSGIIIEDGMFLACEDNVNMEVVSRKNVSSTIFGNEGLFNTVLYGEGIAALESPVPADEVITINIQDDVVKIDGSMAIAWSDSLYFTVQKTTNTLVGSLASGEGLVNVYEGTGIVLVAPVRKNKGIKAPEKTN